MKLKFLMAGFKQPKFLHYELKNYEYLAGEELEYKVGVVQKGKC